MAQADKSNTPPKRKSDQSRMQILAVAAKSFRENGYMATTLRQIAENAQMKAGSIYYHFDSKDDLMVEVLNMGINVVSDAVKSSIAELPRGTNWRQKLEAAFCAHLCALLEYGDFTSANIRTYGQLPETVRERHRPLRLEYAAFWDAMLSNALVDGGIRDDIDPKTLRRLLIGCMNSTTEWYNNTQNNLDTLIGDLCTLVFDGIRAPARKRA